MSNVKINLFMDLIQEKSKSFKYYKKVKKFKKDIESSSPGFDLLWQLSDFIKLAELVFFYNNSLKNIGGLYSSKNYQEGTNGFKIITSEVVITVKLFSKSEEVALEIDRIIGEKIKTQMSFKKSEWTSPPNKYDELILAEVVTMINKKAIELFDWCYDRKQIN